MSAEPDTRLRPIDVVCNLLTPRVIAERPAWTREFLGGKVNVNSATLQGIEVPGLVDRLHAAGVGRALLLAPKMGPAGEAESYHLPFDYVDDAVQARPDVFRGVCGVEPDMSRPALNDVRARIRGGTFVGTHLYPHWFGLPPDDPRYYKVYDLCEQLGVPIQMQVGHCLRYSRHNPLRSVGFPQAVRKIACDFPDLSVIGIHVGWPWTDEMISVAMEFNNVYIGIDAYAPRYLAESLVRYLAGAGRGKVLFGTDWPVVDFGQATGQIAALRLPDAARAALLWGTAEALYRLPPKENT